MTLICEGKVEVVQNMPLLVPLETALVACNASPSEI